MKPYHKIDTLFARDPVTKKLVEGVYRNKTVEYLKDCEWRFTEKIDGTNIRIGWDGYKVSLGGRTDNAQIPAKLMNHLTEKFLGEANAQLFEQKFKPGAYVALYGEGFGDGIQRGGAYQAEQTFILFDINIDGIWLEDDAVEDIAGYFDIDLVPKVLYGTINDAVRYVKEGGPSCIGDAYMEGLVGRPAVEMLDKRGHRVIVKIKTGDFKNE